MKRKGLWSNMDVPMQKPEMDRSSVELSLERERKPSASWSGIMRSGKIITFCRILRDFFLIPDTPARESHCPSVKSRFCMKSRGFPVRGFRISRIRLSIMNPAGDALSDAVTAFPRLIKRSGYGMLTGYCLSYSFSSIVRCRR